MKLPTSHMVAGGSLIKHSRIYQTTLLLTILCGAGVGLFLLVGPNNPTLFSQPKQSVESNTSASTTSALVVYGYLPYWTRNIATFSPLLTHVSYFSLEIQQDGAFLEIPVAARDTGYQAYKNGILPKIRNSLLESQKLEITLTQMDQKTIPLFLESESAQQRFLSDVATLIRTAPISGINLDIEYNGVVDAKLQQSLTKLVRLTRATLDEFDQNLTLSIAAYGDSGSLQRITELKSIASEVDFIIMMAYDYHRSKSPRAGPNSPIYGKYQERWGDDIMHNLFEYTQSVPPEKILLGVPFYGYAWSVEDSTLPNAFTLPKSGESVPYSNIQKILSWPGVRRVWDEDALSPYLTYVAADTPKILYYDDIESLRLKVRLVRQAGLGGIAVWAIGYEAGHPDLWNFLTP